MEAEAAEAEEKVAKRTNALAMAMARARVDSAVNMCEKMVLDKVGTHAAGVFGTLVRRKDPYEVTEAQPPEENITRKRKRGDEENKKMKNLDLLIHHNAAQSFYNIDDDDDDDPHLKYIAMCKSILQCMCYDQFSRTVEDDLDLGPECCVLLDYIHSQGRCSLGEMMKSITSDKLSATVISSLEKLLARKLVECIDALPCRLSKKIRRTPPEYVEDLVLMETTRGDATRFAFDMTNKNQVYRVNYGEFILNLKQSFLNERGNKIDDCDSVITQVQKEKIKALITERFGDDFYRIFTFLSDQPDFVSVDEIKAALKMEVTEEDVQKMWVGGFLCLQRRMISSTTHEFYWKNADSLTLRRNMLEESYKTCLEVSESISSLEKKKKTLEDSQNEKRLKLAKKEKKDVAKKKKKDKERKKRENKKRKKRAVAGAHQQQEVEVEVEVQEQEVEVQEDEQETDEEVQEVETQILGLSEKRYKAFEDICLLSSFCN